MDNLEQFIRENQEKFDSEIPSLSVWAAIDRSVSQAPAPAPAPAQV